MISASIVINTLNRGNLLPNTLSALLHQDFSNFEVIVVNGPSTDNTAEILELWKDRIRIGECPQPNLSMSRNIGIAMASGDIVLFIDDDAVPEPEWLGQIIEGFDSLEVAATGGKVFDNTGYNYQYEYANANRLGNGKWQLKEPSPQFCFPGTFEFPYLQGTNTAFRRSALIEVGGFDEEFVYYLDETEVCLRLIDRGYVVKQLPNAYVHHKYAPSHIRTETTSIYRYPVLKSKVYFSNRHAQQYFLQSEIDDDNKVFMNQHRNDVIENIRVGRLTEKDLEKFEIHVKEAMHNGKLAAGQAPKLITADLLKTKKGQFKNFGPIRSVGERLTVVLLSEDYAPQLLGGIARFTQDKATALAKLGHKVHVITRSFSHNTVDFEDGVWVHRISVSNQSMPKELESLNIPQSHWDQSKSFLNEIDRIAEHRRIDVVEAPIWNIPGIAVHLSNRYKLVTSLMTTLQLSLPSRPDLTANEELMRDQINPLVRLEKYLITESHVLLAISRGIANEIEIAYNLKISPKKLFVAHLGMPDWAVKYKVAKNQKSVSDLNVLFVGRLEKRKGVETLLSAAQSIIKMYPSVKFHIVGDDTITNSEGTTFRKEFERKFPKLIKKNLTFYGKLDDEALREHYANCDIFVAPSLFESFGLIYLEAMMFSKPTIGSDVGGIPEVVAHGITGLLIPPGDEEKLTEAIETLIIDPEFRYNLGIAGRTKFLNEFSDLQMAEKAIELYSKLNHSGATNDN